MKNSFLSSKSMIIPAVAVLLFSTAGSAPETAGDDSDSYRTGLVKLFPGYEKAEKSGPFTYRLLDAAGKELGRLHLEDPEAHPRKRGYAGTIEVGVVTSPDEKIAGVVVGKNKETPSYLKRLDRQQFFQRWNGLKLSDAAKKEVDTVTRATYSSEAIISGVRNAVQTAVPAEKK